MNNLEKLSKIILYDDPSTSNLKLQEIEKYLKSKLDNIEILIRDNFFDFYLKNLGLGKNNTKDETKSKASELLKIATGLARTKIRDLNNPAKHLEPLHGEIVFEEKLLAEPSKFVPGIFYDGFRLHELCQEFLAEMDINRSTCHIIFTPRLFGTFDEFDKRYHARVILCGYPSMISTTGLVEAPAKPKEYYAIKQRLIIQNITTIDSFIPDELRNRYLKYNDPRLTEVIKGYVMQVVSYHLSSSPFCEDPLCRLYNSHWQEELLKAQLSEPEFCKTHESLFSEFNK